MKKRQLFIDDAPNVRIERRRIRRRNARRLMPRASSGVRTDALRQAHGNAVQPTSQALMTPNGPGLADQDKEGRLEHVVRIRRIAHKSPTKAKDHRPVPLQQGRERRFVGNFNVTTEQLGVANVIPRPTSRHPPDVLQYRR
jgi:hypothetical protein